MPPGQIDGQQPCAARGRRQGRAGEGVVEDLRQGRRPEGRPVAGAQGQIRRRRIDQSDLRVRRRSEVAVVFQPPRDRNLQPLQAWTGVGVAHQRQARLAEDGDDVARLFWDDPVARDCGGGEAPGPGRKALPTRLDAQGQTGLTARQGQQRALEQKIGGGRPASVEVVDKTGGDEVEDGAGIDPAGGERIEIAVAGGRIGRVGIVREVAQRLVQPPRIELARIAGGAPLLGQGDIGLRRPAAADLIVQADGRPQAARVARIGAGAQVVVEGIGQGVARLAVRRHEIGIGRRHLEDRRRRRRGEVEPPRAETHVRRQGQPFPDILDQSAIDAVALLPRGQVDALGDAVQIGRPRREIRRGLDLAAGVRPQSIGGDIGPQGGVIGDDIGRGGEDRPPVRAAEGPKVAVTRIGPVQRAERLKMLVFIGQKGRAARPGAADQMGRRQVLAAALGGRGPQPGLLTLDVPAQDDVDHARNGVGAIEGRGAVQQDVHPFHGRRRQGRQVREISPIAASRHTAAVDQHQGRVRAEAAQIDP